MSSSLSFQAYTSSLSQVVSIAQVEYAQRNERQFAGEFPQQRQPQSTSIALLTPLQVIRDFTGNETLEQVQARLSYAEIEELADLLQYARFRYGELGVFLDWMEDPECREEGGKDCFMLFDIIIRDADWDEWHAVSQDLFSQMRLLRGKVAVLSLRGLSVG
ncbi:MAG: hypothetical protein C0167_03050 [Nitrososphaera sp.]|nr:MAG: hypothetical protein C0167_03050 [Nitrososphaera sp.]